MKHITYADKSTFLADEAADVLLEYASVLADHGRADTVELEGMGPDGNEVTVTYLLEPGAPLMAESTNSSMTPPENAKPVSYMRERIMRLSSPPPVRPEDETMPNNYEDLDLHA
jgi:chemotaxis response regulator CheB